ncbi:Abi-alpha family protein [Parvibaculum sp.]|uniref:Abi-alpha family protein n=1 Tax=Parvibaculum sp. TaxID=2024848 RepID=UPI002BC8CAD4|nr:Abi-alpha family protein [Parvibaculum sp.]HUD51728.1 Abi-alpha family protein [Parvibaculum sp.]
MEEARQHSALKMADEPTFPVSVRAEIPEDSSRRIVDAVIDLFSPVTEIAGFLGDKIRAYRTDSALRVFRRTKELANENGLKLSTPPLKFLLPFIEKCSLEEESDDLQEMWSRLLLSASTDFRPEMLIYADIISKMTSAGAQILKAICDEGRSTLGGPSQVADNWIFAMNDRLQSLVLENFDFDDFDASERNFLQNVEWPGVQVCALVMLRFEDDGGTTEYTSYHPSYSDKDALGYSILDSLGLIRFEQHNEIFDDGKNCVITTIASMTTLGGAFYLACQRPGALAESITG